MSILYPKYTEYYEEKLINQLENGDFSELELNRWFSIYEFDYIYAAIEGCDKETDYYVLDFIATFAELLYLKPNTDSYDTRESIMLALEKFNTFSFLEDKTFEELKELLNNRIKEKCENILTKVVLVGCKHPEEYEDIVKSLCYSTSDKVRLYCAANLEYGVHDFSKDVSPRIRKVAAIKESFYKVYNSYDFQINGGWEKVNYFVYALKYGAINTRILTYHPDFEDKILGFIGSKLFDKNIEVEFDLDVFQTMQDKKVLAYVLNCMYEEGFLKFKDSVKLPYYLMDEEFNPKKRTKIQNEILYTLYKTEV